MTHIDYQKVLRYHDRTKHHPHQYARSLGYMDWANQPDPFRHFSGAVTTSLPLSHVDDTPPYARLFEPDRVDPAPLTLASVSLFFEHSLAISAWKKQGLSTWPLRCNPSSGNLHPTECYAALPAIEDLHDRAALYHYEAYRHLLERRLDLPADVWNALLAPTLAHQPWAFLIGLTSIAWRESWKYGERSFRYLHLNAGHALACLRFAATALGWRVTVLAEPGNADAAALLGTDRDSDFPDHEQEDAAFIATVTPAGPVDYKMTPALDLEKLGAVSGLPTSSTASQLSKHHEDWSIVAEITHATSKPRTVAASRLPSPPPDRPVRGLPPPMGSHTARHVILGRRSAVAYDRKTSIPSDTLWRMLTLLMPTGLTPPWDPNDWALSVHLCLFAHRIDGLAPGLYALGRSPESIGRLRSAMRSDFRWSHPPGCPDYLPFFLLEKGNLQNLSAHLSLGQEIAGDGAFSLAMLADFEGPLRQAGPWMYRRIHWEAGMIGQLLYLEAEANGIRGTGIGAYFDDVVHKQLGISDHAFQALYQFTVGRPVEDPRLTTLPPYPPPGTIPEL
ncbi:MAG: SagB/ThcOx family dehydrogenase [Thermodesulfobacteriota bacterium]|nr:SagB/ThcOx family dehydrogenase [Thermodesulfobacteriota bacterium]